MTEDERNTSIVELTDVISTQLGVRERLEAIRIINPQSAVSPTDGEVAIGKLVVGGWGGGVLTSINPLSVVAPTDGGAAVGKLVGCV